MIARLIPQIRPADLDRYVSVVLPRLVENLGHANQEIQINKSAADNLIFYLKRTLQDSQVPAIQRGLLQSSDRLPARIIESSTFPYLPNADEISNLNWEHLFLCLLFLAVEDQKLRDTVLVALHDLRGLVTEDRILRFVQQMDDNDKKLAVQVLRDSAVISVFNDAKVYQFSFVDPDVMDRLTDKFNWRGRIQAVKDLRLIVKGIQDIELVLAEMSNFLLLLAELLRDDIQKVTVLTLEIYDVLIEKLRWRAKQFLSRIVDSLVGHFGDSSSLVRIKSSKALCSLTHHCGPAPVVLALCDIVSADATSTIREEVLNAIILALLTFPSYEFDLYAVCSVVAPLVLDSRSRVRHAALECLAVLAQAMGPSKLATMASAIDAAAEPDDDTEAALAAVLARLARRQLPRITADGQVEYSLRVVPVKESHQSRNQGADVDWILAGDGLLICQALLSSSSSSSATAIGRNKPTEFTQTSASFPSSPTSHRRRVNNITPAAAGSKDSRQRRASSERLPLSNSGLRQQQKLIDWSEEHGFPSLVNSHHSSAVNRPPPPLDEKPNNALISRRRSSTRTLTENSALQKSIDSEQITKLDNSFGNGSSKMKTHNEERFIRPLNKVAAMLGHNILPSKLCPITDINSAGNDSSSGYCLPSVSPISHTSKNQMSTTWSTPGTLPALPVGKNTSISDAPVHTRPTLVRSSSGKRTKSTARNLATECIGGASSSSDSLTMSGHCDNYAAVLKTSSDEKKAALGVSRLPAFRQRLTDDSSYKSGQMNLGTQKRHDDMKIVKSSGDTSPNDDSSMVSLHKRVRPRSVEHDLPVSSENVLSSSSTLRHDLLAAVNRSESTCVHYVAEFDSASDDLSTITCFNRQQMPDGISDDGRRGNVVHGRVFRKSCIRPVSCELQLSSPGENVSSGQLNCAFQRNKKAQTDRLILNSSFTTTNLINQHHGSEINVVGKGMFPLSEGADRVRDLKASLRSHENNKHCNGLIVRAAGNGGVSADDSNIVSDSVDDNDIMKIQDLHSQSLSKSTFNKLMNRKMEIADEAERRKVESKSVGGIDVISKNNNDDDDGNHNNDSCSFEPKTPPGKPTTTRRRLRRNTATNQNGLKSGVGSNKTTKSVENSVLSNPEESLRMAFEKLESVNWHSKCEGIKLVELLAKQHPAVVSNDVHSVNLAIIAEVKNLRSTVARSAIQCFAELFSNIKKHMEPDLEVICKILLHKSGESNVFIKEDVDKSMMQMIEWVTPQKACLAVILGGATHRNAAVRKTTAKFLCMICEKLGAFRILSGAKDITDRILPTAAQFLMDGSPLTRYYGRKIFFMLLSNSDFDRMLHQTLQPSTLRNINDILESLKTKGLGAMPNESASSRRLKVSCT